MYFMYKKKRITLIVLLLVLFIGLLAYVRHYSDEMRAQALFELVNINPARLEEVYFSESNSTRHYASYKKADAQARFYELDKQPLQTVKKFKETDHYKVLLLRDKGSLHYIQYTIYDNDHIKIERNITAASTTQYAQLADRDAFYTWYDALIMNP